MTRPRFESYQSFGERAIDLADKWEELRQQGMTRRNAAAHLGVKFATLDRAIQRARHYRARKPADQ